MTQPEDRICAERVTRPMPDWQAGTACVLFPSCHTLPDMGCQAIAVPGLLWHHRSW